MTITFIVDNRIFPSVEDYLIFLVHRYEGINILKWSTIDSGVTYSKIVFVQSIPPFYIMNKIKRNGWCGLLNIEQLSRKSALKRVLNDLSRTDVRIDYFIDYSPGNMFYMNNFKNIPKILVPFEPISVFNNNSTEHKVAFVGTLSKRRQQILDELTKKGILVTHVKGWGEERDRQISQHRVLLNIHYSHDYKVFESFRCAAWVLHPSVVVVSEESICMEEERGYENICWSSYDNLVDTVQKALTSGYSKRIKGFLEFVDKRSFDSIVMNA